MKIGLILECDRGGTDHKVYEYVAKNICPDVEFFVEPSGSNKPTMIDNCGKVAKILLESLKCDIVLIIWDLMPTWGGEVCRKKDKDQILINLVSQHVATDKVKLICIEPELESWIIADGNALTSYKAQLSHPHKVEKFKPKVLSENDNSSKTIVSKYLGRRYNDVTEALKIVQHIDDFSKLGKKHASFGRFHDFVKIFYPDK